MRSRFSRQAQTILSSAQADAQSRGLNAPAAMDLLSAVMREEGGNAAVLLRRAGIDVQALKALLADPPAAPAGAEQDARQWADVLDAALEEERRLGHELAGTSHLLLGILRHGRSDAAAALRSAGGDLVQFRQIVLSCVGEARAGYRSNLVHLRPNLLAVASEWRDAAEDEQVIIERPDLAAKIMTALRRADSPHVAIIGARGVGKHALLVGIVRELAREGGIAPCLHPLHLEIFKLVGWRWQRAQQKIAEFLNEVRTPGPFVLLIDDMDMFARSPAWDEAALLLRFVLARSAFPVVLVCDATTYESHIQGDPYVMPRLTPVRVPAPQGEEALRILRANRSRLDAFHRVRITDEAIDQAFVAASEVSEQEAFPLACSILDHAAAKARTRRQGAPDALSVAMLDEKLAELARRKQVAVEAQDFHRAAQCRDEENVVKQEKFKLAMSDAPAALPIVDAATIIELVTPMGRDKVRAAWVSQ
ncbi:MAG: ATP-dependent Clp protease ATP-binding subunit [Planctomycetes bacterium]|nr:ATP-dependent Clp protease ATP-binding subunit [Planctomycetota bacterium]